MKVVSIAEFRRNAEEILAELSKGRPILLTSRGKPVARLEPIRDDDTIADDPIYSLSALAVDGESLPNAQIDDEIYGH
jgi:prevent-host-death family protein